MSLISARDKCRRLKPRLVSNGLQSLKANQFRNNYCERSRVLQYAFINRNYEVRKYQPPNLNIETCIGHVCSACKCSVYSVTLESNLFMNASWFQVFLPSKQSVCNCMCPIYRTETKWQKIRTLTLYRRSTDCFI